jgi:V/A-type H+-transporting ATPase subunit I
MSIVSMRRATLIGSRRYKRDVLRQLQAAGVAHVDTRNLSSGEPHRDHVQLLEALDYLLASPQRRRLHWPDSRPELRPLLREIHDNRSQREQIQDRLTLLHRHRQELLPWGEFEFPEFDAIGGQRFWFYLVPLGQRHAVADIALPWVVVNRDHRQLYLVVISPTEPAPEQVPFERSHTGGLSLRAMNAEETSLQAELERLDAERYLLTQWIRYLASQVAQASNADALGQVERASQDDDDLFVLEAWVPADRIPALESLCETSRAALVYRPPEPGEEPPILLDNPEWAAGGEEALKFFQLPGYRSWDPSMMLFFSFSLFFAVILADAGYALAGGLLCLLARPRWKHSRTGRRLGNLGLSMFGVSLIYGVVVGSYFGVTPPADSWLDRLHWLDMDDFGTMMTLSIAVGVLHLILANAIAGWYARPRWRALGYLGWVAMLACGFLLWRSTQQTIPAPLFDTPWPYGLIAGALLVLGFSSEAPFDTWRHRLEHLTGGLTSLAELTQAFGNALSYMRLFALGLSSASLAVTFNQLALQARDGLDGGGTLAFLMILLLGHVLNFALALMGGVVHGLRLNLIEFLRWGVHGEGRPYRAFANKEESTWIK